MMTISTKTVGLSELQDALRGTTRKLPNELAIAVNATSRKVQSGMSKQIREELAVKAKDLKPVLKTTKKAKRVSVNAKVELEASKRLSLKAFSARHTRKGVTYRVSKKGGRQTVPGGFMGPKPGVQATRLGGHAYKRIGTRRKPIARLHGASPWGAYTKNNMRPKTVADGSKELRKQIDRRVRFILMKKQGLI